MIRYYVEVVNFGYKYPLEYRLYLNATIIYPGQYVERLNNAYNYTTLVSTFLFYSKQ